LPFSGVGLATLHSVLPLEKKIVKLKYANSDDRT